MTITFTPLHKFHFSLLLQWFETRHVKKWWDQDVTYTPERVEEKYGEYVQGYKSIHSIKKLMKAFIICLNEQPIGYIQLYNAYDFPRDTQLVNLPQNLGAIDFFIGDASCLRKGLGGLSLSMFLQTHTQEYTYLFVDPDYRNSVAIKVYEKAGFKKVTTTHNCVWMLYEKG